MLSNVSFALRVVLSLYALQFAFCAQGLHHMMCSDCAKTAAIARAAITKIYNESDPDFKLPDDATEHKETRRLKLIDQDPESSSYAIEGSKSSRLHYATGNDGIYIPVKGFKTELVTYAELQEGGGFAFTDATDIPNLLAFEKHPNYEIYMTVDGIAVRHSASTDGESKKFSEFRHAAISHTITNLKIVQTAASGLVLYQVDRIRATPLMILCDINTAHGQQFTVPRAIAGMNAEGTIMAHEHERGFQVYLIQPGDPRFTVKEKACITYEDGVSPLVHSIQFISEQLVVIERVDRFCFYHISKTDGSAVHMFEKDFIYPHIVQNQQYIRDANIYLIVSKQNNGSALRTFYGETKALFVDFETLKVGSIFQTSTIKVSPCGSYMVAIGQANNVLKVMRLIENQPAQTDEQPL